MAEFITWMNRLPEAALYVVLGIGAGVENVLPAVPADTFVALGGFLAAAGDLSARWVFLATWLCNVGGAVFVFRLSHRHGPTFFERGLGRHLVRPHQMRRMTLFYERWGTSAIFFSRFLPGFRAVVPVFAGATHQRWSRVALPIAAASAIWYGGLVQIGILAGRNLDRLASLMDRLNATVGITAGLVTLLVVWLWHRTRHDPDE